jgi:hypothetical protein
MPLNVEDAMRLTALLAFAVMALMVAACDYANSVRKDISLPQSNGPNPANLPDPNFVPKPDAPKGYPAAASPVIMDEVMLNDQQQWVELYNFTDNVTDLGGWIISDGLSSYTFPFGFVVPAGERVVVNLGVQGTDNEQLRHAPNFDTVDPDGGSLALLRAGVEVMHFVQWGGADHGFEYAATQAGLWQTGDFAPAAPLGLALQYDGTANDSTAWQYIQPSRN